ncbi:DUF1653 domain-containing protein [Candidatus Daviesbacteria bacterium]|nr:DUF1653 domain-containing protein [Candidatus Daviesbacteria bacterium]
MKKDILAGVYQHYKGGLYLVLGLARHTETNEKLVVYIPLYTNKSHTGPRIQVRPLKMFFEKVETRGKKQPRFTYLGPELI